MGFDSDVPLAQDFMQKMQEAVEEAKRCLEMPQQRQKAYYDRSHREQILEVGKDVLLSTKNIRCLDQVPLTHAYMDWAFQSG